MASAAISAVSLLPVEVIRNQSWSGTNSWTFGRSLSLQSSIEEVNVVPSILLNPIHCCVCTLDQSPPIGTVLWKDADAYAGGNMKNVRCEVMWGRDCSENLFGDWHQVS